jgi:FMN-dependent NADH-azoreductase
MMVGYFPCAFLDSSAYLYQIKKVIILTSDGAAYNTKAISEFCQLFWLAQVFSCHNGVAAQNKRVAPRRASRVRHEMTL